MFSRSDKKEDSVALEGKRLIVDAMRTGLYPTVFVFSRLNLLQGFPFDLSKDLAMYQVPYRNIKGWSELKTQPGFMGKEGTPVKKTALSKYILTLVLNDLHLFFQPLSAAPQSRLPWLPTSPVRPLSR